MTTLERVHDAEGPEAIQVVFIHGLLGDARSTWMHDREDPSALWPTWIGEDLGCGVWVAGYEAHLSRWAGDAMHLVDLGEALFAAIQAEPNLRGRKLVLVGHSLGGLVIKSGMTQAEASGGRTRLSLLENIVGVVFLGTPHQGADLATVADRLRLLVRTNPQVSNMTSDDGWLKLLNTQFQILHRKRGFKARVLFETKRSFLGKRILKIPIGLPRLIVDRNSSDPNLQDAEVTGIEADHIQIAKPKSRHDPAHKILVDFLDSLEESPPATGRETAGPSAATLDFDELSTRLRNASAQLLSWPRTLPDGTHLARPEMDVLNECLATESTSTHFLLGDPGCGKSSLLGQLAQEKQDAGWFVLAIKADRLSPDLLDREALARYLELGADTSEVLRGLTTRGPVLLVLDQVDALAELVVQHSARLRILLDLVRSLSDVPNVHIVISCRTFEQKHDPALRDLNAIHLKLELPDWSRVAELLKTHGLQAEAWNEDIQQVLRSPHALDTFLSLLDSVSEPGALESFQGLLERQWETQVLCDGSGRRKTAIKRLASVMADREVLGLPLAEVEDHYAEIVALESAGLLRLGPGLRRVEFRHQTLYEFVRARSFLEDGGSLTEAVICHQESLRIRPQLWHALGYFRGVSPEKYAAELGKLWAAELRPHLRMLLIEFLGLQGSPLLAERRLVEESMTDDWFLPRFIGAAVDSPGWFDFLAPTHLPRLMALPLEQVQILLPILSHALRFRTDEVVDLVRRNWLSDQNRDPLSWQVLGSVDVPPKVGPRLDSLVLIAERSPISEWAIGPLADAVSQEVPEEAPRLVAAWLKRQIDSAKARLSATSEGGEIDIDGVSPKEIESILEAQQFHDMELIAEAAPEAFVRMIWPLFSEALCLCPLEDSGVVDRYNQSGSLLFQELGEEEYRFERPLLRAMQFGMEGWAGSDPSSYLDFVSEHQSSENLFVHRLLAVGLLRAVNHAPQRVLDYLLADPRRLQLGPYTDLHKESSALIEAVSPLLDRSSLARLERALLDWRFYNVSADRDDANLRHERLQWDRQHRLRLLRALPEGVRSAGVQQIVDEEERAFPGLTNTDVEFSGAKFVGSPVNAEQMHRGADVDVLNLFCELTDDTAWRHPRHHMQGGAIQAGRELARLARIDLPKTLRILRGLVPGANEIPAGCTLMELVPAGLVSSDLYALVAELEDKGFAGPGFRRDAAQAIAKAAQNESPVPDDLIDRMERWLTPCESEPEIESGVDSHGDKSPVLWSNGLITVLPQGNYPTLNALTVSCLSFDPPRLDRWLRILESHVLRTESARVWEAMLNHELLYLRDIERSRAECLVDSLISSVPSIVETRSWARFVARANHWASSSAVRRWLMVIENSGGGLQGVGEILGLRHALFHAEDWSREQVNEVLECQAEGGFSAVTVGLAHSVANLWHEPMTRPVVHPILLRMLRSSDEEVLGALSAIFLRDAFPADLATRELLDELVAFPGLLGEGRATRLCEVLVELVDAMPELVCQIAHLLVDAAGDEMGNIATSWYFSSESLLDIALRLQDMGAAERAAGSRLFERMLEFNMPQARDMTLDLDKRTPAAGGVRASVRRRRRSLRRNS